MKILTIASHTDFPGHTKLIESLKKNGYSWDVQVVPFQFGRQMKTIYKWCQANWGDFLYTDAYDTVALDTEEACKKLMLYDGKMLISTEKACYPNPNLATQYPTIDTPWKYVNGGGFTTTCDFFCKLYEEFHEEESNDQEWLAERYLYNQKEIALDTRCEIFQTIAFEGDGDFTYDHENHRLINNIIGTKPIFIHGNGHTDMSKIYKL